MDEVVEPFDVRRARIAALTSALAADVAAQCSDHQVTQHRDGRRPWCNACELDNQGRVRAQPDAEATARHRA